MAELAVGVAKEIWSIFSGAVGPVAVIGLLGWMFREKWKQMLARSLGVDLEREKASALREIEAYKVALIADAERSKAVVELKKVIAVKHTTQEYESLVELYTLLMGATSTVITRATLVPTAPADDPIWGRELEVASKARDALDEAVGRANLFLQHETGIACMDHSASLLLTVTDHLMVRGSAPLSGEARTELQSRAAQLRARIKERIEELVRIAEAGRLA